MSWNFIREDEELSDVPDDERDVLYATGDDYVGKGWFDWTDDGTGYVWRDAGGSRIDTDVTAWMELPKHPKITDRTLSSLS